MLIEITQEAVEMAIDINDPTDQVWMNINDALRAMLHKSHITFMDRKTLKILEKQSQLNSANSKVLKWIERHFDDLYSIKQRIKHRLILTKNKTSYEDSIYYVQIYKKINFNNAKLLTEDESDYTFYTNIFRAMNNSEFVTINLDNIPYHGGHVKNAIQSQNSAGYFTLCIVDSDKHHPNSSVGETCAQAVKAARNHFTPEAPINVYTLAVHEKENLYPFKEYLPFCRNRKKFIEAILECCDESGLKYIDIKGGININNTDQEWLKYYSNLIEKCKTLKIYNNEGQVSGIGNKALGQACMTFFPKVNYTFFQNSTLYSKFFDSQKYILNEWKMIAQQLFDFGCCLPQNTKFNV